MSSICVLFVLGFLCVCVLFVTVVWLCLPINVHFLLYVAVCAVLVFALLCTHKEKLIVTMFKLLLVSRGLSRVLSQTQL